MDYDYEAYERCLMHLLNGMWRDVDELEIGENISDVSEVKIIFDGYGYNEETDEQDDTNLESYAIFIHKDALTEDFEFPEHDMTPWALIHRPKEEICIFAWYDVANDTWEMQSLEEIVENTSMKEDDVMRILLGLEERYFSDEE
jgi:hypothetical protein